MATGLMKRLMPTQKPLGINKMTKKPIPSTTEGTAIVYWSDNKELYYLPEYCEAHSFWLGQAVDGPLSADQKNSSGLFSPGWLQIKTKDKKIYHRKLLRFSFWSVQRQLKIQENIPISDNKIQDYFAQLCAEKRM